MRARIWGVLWVAAALAKLTCVGAFITATRAPSAITPAALDVSADTSSARSQTVATRPDRKRADAIRKRFGEQREREAGAPVEGVSATASLVPPPPAASDTTTEYPLALSP